MLTDLLHKQADLAREDHDDFFNAEMNARVVKGAESYYRSVYYGRVDSWNLRDTHMFETLDRLRKAMGGAKAVVWAHNSHVGDARQTSMGMSRGKHNIGQLCRENYGRDVYIIGCGTHTGTVAAAHNWGEPMEIMDVLPSLRDSYERIMSVTGVPRFLLDLRENAENEKLRKALMKPKLERFIGVIYRPDTERWSHYSEAVLPKQMDAYVFFNRTQAVKAFDRKQPENEDPAVEETYPFGE
ncbi:erythromycin esterase [Aphelenchoides avenae]|nr:erythromycin esterase [Aphelenchus avenae]